MAEDENLQKRLRGLQGSRAGRAKLRERVEVEHRLAHLAGRQGRRARNCGVRKNLYDLRRHAAVLNLEVIARRTAVVSSRRAGQGGFNLFGALEDVRPGGQRGAAGPRNRTRSWESETRSTVSDSL